MSKLKKMAPLLLAGIYVLTAWYLISSKLSAKSQYMTYVDTARNCAEDGIVVDAMEFYQKALELRPSSELAVEAGNVYLSQEQYEDASWWYRKVLKTNYEDSPETYEYGLMVYTALEKYSDAYDCYGECAKRNLMTEEVESLYRKIQYSFKLRGRYGDVSVFSNLNQLAAVEYNGLWGYIDAQGNEAIPFIYKKADVFSALAGVVDEAGQVCFIDQSGAERLTSHRLLKANPEISTFEDVKSESGGFFCLSYDDQWAYFDAETLVRQIGPYPNVKPISNGIGAVSDEYGKWALINQEGKLITDFIFDQVLNDEKEVICRTSAIVVKKGETYFLVDHNGQQIGKETYEEGYAFADNSFAAMKRGGEWYFVDESGAERQLGSFDQAKSFSGGFAAVKQGEKWGYITPDGTLAIDFQFDDVKPFSAAGVTFVKEENVWRLLQLYQPQ